MKKKNFIVLAGMLSILALAGCGGEPSIDKDSIHIKFVPEEKVEDDGSITVDEEYVFIEAYSTPMYTAD